MSAIHVRFFLKGKSITEHNTGDFRKLNGGIKRHYEILYAPISNAPGAPNEYDSVQVYQQQ